MADGSTPVKVFQLNEYDWWAGRNLEEVKAAYLVQSGVREDEAFEDPREVSEAEMDWETFRRDDGEDGTVVTFREQLSYMISQGAEFPTFFASTEF